MYDVNHENILSICGLAGQHGQHLAGRLADPRLILEPHAQAASTAKRRGERRADVLAAVGASEADRLHAPDTSWLCPTPVTVRATGSASPAAQLFSMATADRHHVRTSSIAPGSSMAVGAGVKAEKCSTAATAGTGGRHGIGDTSASTSDTCDQVGRSVQNAWYAKCGSCNRHEKGSLDHVLPEAPRWASRGHGNNEMTTPKPTRVQGKPDAAVEVHSRRRPRDGTTELARIRRQSTARSPSA